MRDMAKKRAHDTRRHRERMATDLRYRLRKILNTINARCYTGKGRTDWNYYGGKGIQNFLTLDDLVHLWERDNADLKQQPTLDRIDPDGHYCLDNVRFIERSDNATRIWDEDYIAQCKRISDGWQRKLAGEK